MVDRRRWLRSHNPFLILLALFIVAGVLTQLSLPPLEGVDETLHDNYVVRLRADGMLPDRSTNRTNGTRQESGQPPLTYWVMASFLNVIGAPLDRQDPLSELNSIRNLWYTPPDPWRRTDNENVYLDDAHGNLIAFPAVGDNDRRARWVSLAFGVLAVIAAYGVMGEVFDARRWVLVGTALFAFMPILLQISADVSNDGGAVAFATCVIWQTLCFVRARQNRHAPETDRADRVRLLLIGVLLGLTALSKLNAVLIGSGVITALLIDWRVQRRSVRQMIGHGLLVAIPFTLLIGPWVLYGWLNFHSPFGLEGHTALFGNPQQGLPSIGAFLTACANFALTYIGSLGAGGIRFAGIIYVLFGLLALLAVVGYGLWLRSGPRILWQTRRTQQAAVLLVIALTMIAGIVYWLLTLFDISNNIQARLIYPAHAVFILIVTGGLYQLSQHLPGRWQRRLRLFSVALPVTVSLLLAPLIQQIGYAPSQMLTTTQLPPLQGQPFDFDHTIRFLGYQPSDALIHAGAINTFTLCWQILKWPTRDAALSLKIFDQQGHSYGDRTSIPGLGHYAAALWQPGAIFCDAVDMAIAPNLPTHQSFNLLIVLLDPHTMAVDWSATLPDSNAPVPYPVIVQVRS